MWIHFAWYFWNSLHFISAESTIQLLSSSFFAFAVVAQNALLHLFSSVVALDCHLRAIFPVYLISILFFLRRLFTSHTENEKNYSLLFAGASAVVVFVVRFHFYFGRLFIDLVVLLHSFPFTLWNFYGLFVIFISFYEQVINRVIQ